MSRSVVVELSRARWGQEGRKAMLQVSRWLNLVQAWSGQLTVAPCKPTIDPEEGPSGNENDDDDDCGRDSAGEVNIYKAP